MRIKPPDPGQPLTPSSNDGVNDARKPAAKFALPTGAAAPAPGAPSGGFASLKADFRKADLRDPQKADKAVGAAVNELIGADESAVSLTDADRGRIAAAMRNDPAIRGKILGHLEKILD